MKKPEKENSNRRNFLKAGALFALAGTAIKAIGNPVAALSSMEHAAENPPPPPMPFNLPPLPYAYEALEPHIDRMTMEIHYTKHHQAYVNNLNTAVAGTETGNLSLDDICKNISKYPSVVRNNAGGHYNHSMFWSIMKQGSGGAPSGAVAEAINNSFTSFEEFRKKFNTTALARFGSGWTWLVVKDGKLEIGSTPNQDNPLMDISDLKGTPLLGLDVWEHAYYLKYQNKRADYVNAWWNLVNWEEVGKRLGTAK